MVVRDVAGHVPDGSRPGLHVVDNGDDLVIPHSSGQAGGTGRDEVDEERPEGSDVWKALVTVVGVVDSS